MSKVIYRGPAQRQRIANARRAREKYDAELAISGSVDATARMDRQTAAALRAYPELAELKTLLDAQLRAVFRRK